MMEAFSQCPHCYDDVFDIAGFFLCSVLNKHVQRCEPHVGCLYYRGIQGFRHVFIVKAFCQCPETCIDMTEALFQLSLIHI